MTTDFSGQSALVTGGGRGLGLAIVAALRAAGARVAINDRTPEAVERAIARLGGGPDLQAAPADLALQGGPEQAVEQALDALGGLDMLVNNAAVNIEAPIEATDAVLWDRHLAVVPSGRHCRRSPRPAGRSSISPRSLGCTPYLTMWPMLQPSMDSWR